MSDDTDRDAAAAHRMAASAHQYSSEASRTLGDSADAWVGYESAFPFPMEDMTGSGRWDAPSSVIFL